MGFISLLLQITVLRELLTVFSGNELDIGITLSLWLVFVGLGSFTGSRLSLRQAFGLSFILVALLSQPTIAGIKSIRPVLSLEHGETASLIATFFSTALCLFPLCFALGLQFPLAVSYKEGKNPAGRVYGFEALGAFLGGLLFTFFISGRIETASLVASLSLISILLSFYILRRKALMVFFIVPLIFHFSLKSLDASLWRGGELIKKVQSRYGEIWVTGLENQLSVYSGGHFLFTYPDPQLEEFKVHLPVSVHPQPEYILTIGGSPGALKEFLKYPIRRVDFVEIDPELVETSLMILNEQDRKVAEDKRVRIIIEDGRRFIKSLNQRIYDLVILNLPEPSTANMNRFYTKEFFDEVKGILRKNGILALTLPTSAGYVGKRMQLANGAIFNSLKAVFPYVEVTTEEYGGLFASESPLDLAPESLIQRFLNRGVKTVHFQPYIIDDAFMPLRAGFHKSRLSAIDVVNTDLKPTAYLYNLMLWAEIHGGRFLNTILGLKGYTALIMLAVFLTGAFAVFRKRKPTLYYSIFTTGYAGMTFMLSILLSYQASYGYVYEMFGLLAAIFMVGTACGTYVMRGTGIRGLLFLEPGAAFLALISPLFFGKEVLFYVLSFSTGMITGCAFAVVSFSVRDTAAGGRLYAFDLAGSFIGAFLTAIVFIPVLGIRESLLLVAGIKIISAFLIFFIRNE